MNRAVLKWVPAAGIPVVIVAAALVAPLQASAAVDLPDKTPQEVLAMIGDSSVDAFSGTVEQSSELGLPDLSGMSAGSGASGQGEAAGLDLLTGSHTVRVFADGAEKSRLQVMDDLAERDVIRNGYELWYFDSESQEATHATLPSGADQVETTVGPDHGTPADVAAELVQRLEPSTTLSVSDDTEVAGRTAYTLVLTPKDDDTLIGSASIVVDSKSGLPLRVAVTAVGEQDPALQIEFTQLTLEAPSADLFSFDPPAGSTVTEQKLPDHGTRDGHGTRGDHGTHKAGPTDGSGPTVIGSGWSQVVELAVGKLPAEITGSPLFAQATTAVPGGRVLSTSLVNVLLTDDGRVLAGAVSAERLQAAAGE